MSEAFNAGEEAFITALNELGDGSDGDEVLVIVTRAGRSEAFSAVGGEEHGEPLDLLRLLVAHTARVAEVLAEGTLGAPEGRLGADRGSG